MFSSWIIVDVMLLFVDVVVVNIFNNVIGVLWYVVVYVRWEDYVVVKLEVVPERVDYEVFVLLNFVFKRCVCPFLNPWCFLPCDWG